MGIWGHNIGVSISMRAMSVQPDAFDAALLYAPVSQRYGGVVPGSDIYDLNDVKARLNIHPWRSGRGDRCVGFGWVVHPLGEDR
jgi:hypothetical protein